MAVWPYVLFLVFLVLLGAQLFAARAFRAKALALASRLTAAPPVSKPGPGLPPIVAAFARRAGAGTGEPVRNASFNQHAELRTRPGGPFGTYAARQVMALGEPGFLWEARQDIGPFPKLRVIDSYVADAGHLQARLLGTIPVVRASGPDIALSEGYRYLAELPWAPDAMLGNPLLKWRTVDARLAEVALETPGGTARVMFEFDKSGDIVAMLAKGRPATNSAGIPARYDWRGRYSDYRRIGARRVPALGEVGYVYPSGYETYFRGRVTEYRISG
jgi:hypothetical protein